MTVQRIPLIFALKHLHIQWEDQDVTSPRQLTKSASLMQGDRRIPPASEALIDGLLREECHGVLPHDVELKLLEMCFPDWPQDVAIAFHAISTFGAGGIENAKTCAQHVLKAHRDCTLARQLVSLLSTTTEVRCPYGGGAQDIPDVPEIVSSQNGLLPDEDTPQHK